VSRITIALDPVLVQLGPFPLRWYSLMIGVAIAAALALTSREARRKGLAPEIIPALAAWAIGGGIAGARLLHVADRFEDYRRDPAAILNVAQGGLAIFGAVLGGALATWLFARRYGLSFATLADTIAPGLVLAQGIGRLGCVVNGDAWGAPTGVPWAFVYTNPRAFIPAELLGVPTHPYPLYDLALNVGIFALLWRLRARLRADGALFLIYLALYALGRFGLTVVRQERVWFWGLQEAQVLALVAFVAAAAALARLALRRRGAAGVAPEAA
jgi:phosphatidylglycerol---prolipoprotein diacylglyceryl transferase